MFLFGNFIGAVAVLLNIILSIYMWIVIIRALISWVNPDPYNPIVQMLHRITEPVLAPLRRRLPDFGGLDISPVIVLLGILFLQLYIVPTLKDLGSLLR